MKKCTQLLIEAILSNREKPFIFYGEASAGKTSIVLSLAKWLNKDFLYINTEGAPNNERVLQVLGTNVKGSYYEALDNDSLMAALIGQSVVKKELIIVDSINSFFRVRVGESLDKAVQELSFALGVLSWYSFHMKKIVLATAQVAGPDSVPSGLEILMYFKPNLFNIAKQDGVRKIVFQKGFEGEFSIESDGISWIRCSTI